MAGILFRDNDNFVQLSGLKDESSGSFISNATVQCTILDDTGVEVAGISWPVDMPYVPASDGVYQAVIDKTMTITRGAFYIVEIVATTPGGMDAKWEIKVQGASRDA